MLPQPPSQRGERRRRRRRRRMPRRQRREKELELEYEETVLAKASDAALAAKDDNDLFFIDRGGSQNAKRKIEAQTAVRKTQSSISVTERKLIERAQQKIQSIASSSAKTGKGDDKIIDIWGSDSGAVTRKRQRQRSEQRLHSSSKEGKHSLKILSGHSYNPSLEEHQDALAEVHHVVVIETSVLFSVQS